MTTDLTITRSETRVPVLPAMLGVDHELAALELCERKGLSEPRHEGYVTATATAGPEDIGLRLRAPVLPPRRISGQAVGGGDAVQRSVEASVAGRPPTPGLVPTRSRGEGRLTLRPLMPLGPGAPPPPGSPDTPWGESQAVARSAREPRSCSRSLARLATPPGAAKWLTPLYFSPGPQWPCAFHRLGLRVRNPQWRYHPDDSISRFVSTVTSVHCHLHVTDEGESRSG